MFVCEYRHRPDRQRTCDAMVAANTRTSSGCVRREVIDLPTIRAISTSTSALRWISSAPTSRRTPRVLHTGSRDGSGRRRSTTTTCSRRYYPVLEFATAASASPRRRRSTRSTRSCATTSSATPPPASSAEQGHREAGDPVPAQGAAQGVSPPDRNRARRCADRRTATSSSAEGRQMSTLAAERGDQAFVASLMGRVVEPGKFANWIARQRAASTNKPTDSRTSGSTGVEVAIVRRRNGCERHDRGDSAALIDRRSASAATPARKPARSTGYARRAELRRRRRQVHRLQRVHLACPTGAIETGGRLERKKRL